MKIESKYEIGTEFWVIYNRSNGGLEIYKDKIKEIVVLSDGIEYIGEDTLDGVREEDIIIDDKDILYEAMNRMVGELVDTPLVLHGGSGLSDNDFKATIENGISKIIFYIAFAHFFIYNNKKYKFM